MSSTPVAEQKSLVFNAVPSEVLIDPRAFIGATRQGVPGRWLKCAVEATGLRGTFASLLNVSSHELSTLYRKKALPKPASEQVLHAIRVLHQACCVWESNELALTWLNSVVPALNYERPLSLFDTFEGRRLVSQVLSNIDRGEFS